MDENKHLKLWSLSSRSELVFTNETDHDISALVLGQYGEYLRHFYIRTKEEFTFKDLPITRFLVQFKAKNFILRI